LVGCTAHSTVFCWVRWAEFLWLLHPLAKSSVDGCCCAAIRLHTFESETCNILCCLQWNLTIPSMTENDRFSSCC
jgi:hypothetical protein